MKNLKVLKRVLENGLTVLVVPRKIVPTVSVQLWYNVGSKDEKSGQKGIAHLIEHMIFKGTEKLSECDINLITQKLSGYCNAFTSYDYTGYLFDFPSHHWQEAFSIMSDCMRNCTFKQEYLNSELKAVIQELKMYKDDYVSSATENLLSAMFYDHPYHHPIIGYKQDLWNLDRNELERFYKYHYIPNNATLVVVGDVEPENVFELAKESFGNIEPNWDYKKEQFYHTQDLRSCNLSLYRDVKQPSVLLSWEIPGASKGQDYLTDIVSWVIGSGRGSRLYKKLVDELELVTELDVFNYDLFEYGLLFIYFQPKDVENIKKITDIISKELELVVQEGASEREILRAIKKTETDYLSMLEENQKQAYGIGKYFLATGDEQFVYNYTNYPKDGLAEKVNNFIAKYLRASLMNVSQVMPIDQKEKKHFLELQELSDEEDNRILEGKERTAEVEPGKCVLGIDVKTPKKFEYPKSSSLYLNNGLKVLYFNNPSLPKVDLVLDFKSKYYFDPKGLQGLSSFSAQLLQEGTNTHSAGQFADILETYGMSLNSSAGSVSLETLSVDLSKGLELFSEVLTEAAFEGPSIERVRGFMLSDLNEFWDKPMKFVNQLAKEHIYKDHPYGKNSLGTIESINNITRLDLLNHYQKNLSPRGSVLALSGDIERYDIKDCLGHMLHGWQGSEVSDMIFPTISAVEPKEINYPIMRDQVVLCYAGLSVSRLDPDYDKLLLFDQILTGGVLGSMSSRLFDLRERSGLFYTIGGSLVYGVAEQPGMMIIKTIVSNDKLAQAEKSIENVIDTAVLDVSDEEFYGAQRALANSLVDNFTSDYKIASSILFKDRYDFPADFFDTRAQKLMQITKEEMQEVVKKHLSSGKMLKIRAGRV